MIALKIIDFEFAFVSYTHEYTIMIDLCKELFLAREQCPSLFNSKQTLKNIVNYKCFPTFHDKRLIPK